MTGWNICGAPVLLPRLFFYTHKYQQSWDSDYKGEYSFMEVDNLRRFPCASTASGISSNVQHELSESEKSFRKLDTSLNPDVI